MVRTSKSPKAVARAAYAIAQQSVPSYSHTKSPHKFTQPQLITILVLKEFFKADYRGITEILTDSSDLRAVIELTTIPHYTTIQKAAHRLTKKDTLDRLTKRILATAQKAGSLKKHVALAAVYTNNGVKSLFPPFVSSCVVTGRHARPFFRKVYREIPDHDFTIPRAESGEAAKELDLTPLFKEEAPQGSRNPCGLRSTRARAFDY